MVGMLIGLMLRLAWIAVLVSLAAGGLGWGIPLALLAFNEPIGRIAAVVEAVIGLTATVGTIIILLTVVLGCVLSIVGTWVGIAARRLFIASSVMEKTVQVWNFVPGVRRFVFHRSLLCSCAGLVSKWSLHHQTPKDAPVLGRVSRWVRGRRCPIRSTNHHMGAVQRSISPSSRLTYTLKKWIAWSKPWRER